MPIGIREETTARALAMIVEAQSKLPMARFCGDGTTSSSDGQHFPAGSTGEALNVVNARYGNDPGLSAYGHVSDQYAPYSTQVIPATAHEAPYILDGLLQMTPADRSASIMLIRAASRIMSLPSALSSASGLHREYAICRTSGSMFLRPTRCRM